MTGTLSRPTRRRDGVLARVRIDLDPSHLPPRHLAWALASALALGGSLGLDALLVAVGTRLFPSTRGYGHFHFGDYARLTVIGVLIACVGWGVVTRVSSAPRWLFLRAAIAITVVLWLPDVYILVQGQPARAVAVLMCMHLAIAVVTYEALVHLAPIRRARMRQSR